MDGTAKAAADDFLEKSSAKYLESGRMIASCKGIERAQISGLRRITATAQRFIQIEDWLLGQIGRSGISQRWRSSISGGSRGENTAGELLLRQLRGIRDKSKDIAGEQADDWVPVAFYIARGWARRIEAAYLYHRAEAQ